MPLKSYNAVVSAMAARAMELANKPLPALREEAGYDCDTAAEARRVHRHTDRGTLIELILMEEFCEQFDIEWEQP